MVRDSARAGSVIMIVDLLLLALGGIIAVTGGSMPSVGVFPVAAAAVIIACLVMRRLPFVLSAILAVCRGCCPMPGVRATETRGLLEQGRKHQRAAIVGRVLVLFAALTLIMIASYRPSPEARTGHELRSTGIVTSIVLALAAVVSVVFVHLVNADWCYQQSDSPCRTNALGFELPVLLAR